MPVFLIHRLGGVWSVGLGDMRTQCLVKVAIGGNLMKRIPECPVQLAAVTSSSISTRKQKTIASRLGQDAY